MEKYRFTEDQKSILEKLQVPFAVYQYIDKRIVTLALSDGFCELFGYEDRAKAYYDMDNNMYTYTHPDDSARVAEAAVRFAREGGKYEVIYRSRKRTASEYTVIHSFGRHYVTEDGSRIAYVWYADEGEYTEESSNESILNATLNDALRQESILRENRFDYLTGLPSMTYFFELVETTKNKVIGRGDRPVLLYLDLGGLKYFNHKHGFANGDKLLQSFAKLLADTFGNDYCSRIASDHYAVFCTLDGIEETIARLFKQFANQRSDSPPIRIGIYNDPSDETVPVSVAIDRAKLACDMLKGSPVSAYCFYHHELQDRMVKKQHILENFDTALKERRIAVYFQPIVRAVNGRVCDEEALSRWNDPELGLLSSNDFIPTLEETGLIYKLDLYVLDRVLEKIADQKAAGLTIIPHSINLSRSDFDACDIVEETRKRVDDAGIDRELITIEITESVIASDFDFMKKQIERFRELGFRVWMDDFGSAYSSLDVLQSIPFDLIKFDMSFMKKFNEGESGKIILSELVKMANSLGLDTVCEGVETEEQVRFLKEIGCSKLQGFYFCKPIPYEELRERYKNGTRIGYESPEESDYYKIIGGINLNDLAVIAADDLEFFHNSFNTLPMGIIEIKDDKTRFVRSNASYREFIKRYFGLNLSHEGTTFTKYSDSFMHNVVNTCCKNGVKAFYDESMPDGTVVHSFARKIADNPVTGTTAVALAVLSITTPNEGATYASIARALATDYYNIYYVDLDTDKFIEYTSPVGGEELALERHGEHFFEACIEAADRIYVDDRAAFFASFSKEKVLRELDEQGVFNTTYRLMDTGEPMYVNMKITRMQKSKNQIIIGISIVDQQMKHKDSFENIKKDHDTLVRMLALSEDYLSLYTVDPETNGYLEYNATKEYESLGFAKHGDDFFLQGLEDGRKTVYPEDLPLYEKEFTKEKVMAKIRGGQIYRLHYRLMINGEPKPVSLRIAMFRENGDEKLVAGVRLWRERQ